LNLLGILLWLLILWQ
jgi:hypothetical protein